MFLLVYVLLNRLLTRIIVIIIVIIIIIIIHDCANAPEMSFCVQKKIRTFGHPRFHVERSLQPGTSNDVHGRYSQANAKKKKTKNKKQKTKGENNKQREELSVLFIPMG